VRNFAAPFRRGPSAAVGVSLVEHIYAQVIDDRKGETLASASSLEKDMREKDRRQYRRGEGRRQIAAERAVKKGVKEVVFEPRQLSLSRSRQGAGGCGSRERIELLIQTTRTEALGLAKIGKHHGR